MSEERSYKMTTTFIGELVTIEVGDGEDSVRISMPKKIYKNLLDDLAADYSEGEGSVIEFPWCTLFECEGEALGPAN
jgi:hypothetical protein